MLVKISRLNVNGLAIFPFIFTKNNERSKTLINHELIHHRQQLELFIFPFYLFYVYQYFVGLVKYKNSYKAYMNICFEKEAYANDQNLNYLKYRKLWAFLNYI
ncbi:MAG: hypothetical protein V4683_00570 [Bacteroidota bacterium]